MQLSPGKWTNRTKVTFETESELLRSHELAGIFVRTLVYFGFADDSAGSVPLSGAVVNEHGYALLLKQKRKLEILG